MSVYIYIYIYKYICTWVDESFHMSLLMCAMRRVRECVRMYTSILYKYHIYVGEFVMRGH